MSGLDPYYATEDARQHSLFIKLSIARIVSFSVCLHQVVPWNETLDESRLVTLLTTQLLLGVIVPLIQSLDLRGTYRRWVTASRLAVSVIPSSIDGSGGESGSDAHQDSVNHCWEHSSAFILAEHSSRMISTCSMCLVHVVAAPAAGLVLLLSLLVTFMTDSYLLARRQRIVLLHRSQLATSCVVALLVVLCLHAYMSCRLVFSWPFDEAFINEEGLVERVDKRPPLLLLWDMADRDPLWHSHDQRRFLRAYVTLTRLLAGCLVVILVVKILRLGPLLEWLWLWLRRRQIRGGVEDDMFSCAHQGRGKHSMQNARESESERQKRNQHQTMDERREKEHTPQPVMRYSGVQHIGSYCPRLGLGEEQGQGDGDVLLCCDVSEVLSRYLPETRSEHKDEDTNLAAYVRDLTLNLACLTDFHILQSLS